MNNFDKQRRLLLQALGSSTAAACLMSPTGILLAADSDNSEGTGGDGARKISLGDSTLHVLSDGNLSLPISRLFETDEQADEMMSLFQEAGLSTKVFQPPLNITLLQTQDRLVLFDVGSGSQFMDTAGLLPAALEASEIDPLDVTDVVFTHAHPDHCWGLLDDFDELLCPDATYHMHGTEFDHWMSEDTLNNADEGSLGMVAGARNRLPLIEEQLKRFNWGDEVLPGVEAVDTHGHTPGHTSFAIHQGDDSVMVLGDALIHPVLSFQRPQWRWLSDQDAEAAANTRKQLLDRLAGDKTGIIGYHLPDSGYGVVEQSDGSYRYVAA
jgi:glyoxylase-like metal-dependent hydrolase (beta-lactamase superfamily II)